ncbi:hypothetical protein OIU84_010041 [Salix udensis]|uniref:Uncharacterized protein n=1 Tax=Salix udensis TaxID=889485 RepID=A0AAD6JJT9_9ROSI|nr:hypothetical protein OIU84_010041 [Salix udensis]
MITGAGAGSFVIVPNWRCNGVAVVFRAVSRLENQYAVAMRSRFSNMAVVADGIRQSSTGQLYMVDCLGIVDSEGKTCNSNLAEDLTLYSSAFPDPLPRSPPRTAADFHIHMRKLFNPDEAQYTEKQLLINVSVQITLDGEAYSNFTELFLEALYDPRAGKMYIVGCRDVRASWNILSESMDQEAGFGLFNWSSRVLSTHYSPVKLSFRGSHLKSYESSSYYPEKNQWLNGIDYVVKIPVMALSEGVEISYQITYKKPL